MVTKTKVAGPSTQASGPELYLFLAAVGISFFTLQAWLLSLYTEDFWRTLRTTAIHGAIFSAVMTWAYGGNPPPLRERQLTLRDALGRISMAAICTSFVTQIIRAAPGGENVSMLDLCFRIAFFGLFYFNFTMPFAACLGIGVLRLGERFVARLHLRSPADVRPTP